MTLPDIRDQREFVDGLTFSARQWLGPMPADLPHLDPLHRRLGGLVFSLFPELEGAGNIRQMRLSPKGRPDVDLVDHGPHDQWPDTDADDPDVAGFLTAVAGILRAAQAAGGERREAMGRLLVDLCLLIEDSHELAPIFFDDDSDAVVGEGDDIAPGLTAAVETAWVRLCN